jgi:hypothetical protein
MQHVTFLLLVLGGLCVGAWLAIMGHPWFALLVLVIISGARFTSKDKDSMNNYQGRIEIRTDSSLPPGTLQLLIHPSESKVVVELLKSGVVLKVTPQTVDGAVVNTPLIADKSPVKS